ncbi:MAG TPA: hypothetical protein VK636_11600 [Gemmatimonadaceae bacterium]|nr:hypothetical protein [Gemmatimonadaceae bacterium]
MLTPTLFQQPTPTIPRPPSAPGPVTGGVSTPGVPAVVDEFAAIQSLAEQVAALRAQQRVLVTQTHSRDPGVAMSAQTALPAVESQLAKATIDLAVLRARQSARQGRPGTSDFFQPPDRSRPNADQITFMGVTFMLAVMMPISIAISRRIFRRASGKSVGLPPDVISPRLDRLEQAVDAVAIEVERISEGQRFVTKVLVERPVAARPAAMPEAHDSSGLAAPSPMKNAAAEPKPFLALGAGPIEPIRVAERQTVRQSVTPH